MEVLNYIKSAPRLKGNSISEDKQRSAIQNFKTLTDFFQPFSIILDDIHPNLYGYALDLEKFKSPGPKPEIKLAQFFAN